MKPASIAAGAGLLLIPTVLTAMWIKSADARLAEATATPTELPRWISGGGSTA